MGGIIAAILAIVGPILGDLLKKWLDKLLNKAAADPSVAGFEGDDAAKSRHLLTTAIGLTKPRQRFRRHLLRQMISDVPPVVAAGGTKLPKALADEMAATATATPAAE